MFHFNALKGFLHASDVFMNIIFLKTVSFWNKPHLCYSVSKIFLRVFDTLYK
jgi:hypothetical protein